MRLALAALVLTLVIATDAAAAPRSIARVPEEASVALAGDAVLVARPRGRTVRVDRLPLDGVSPRSRVFSVRLPGLDYLRATVAASPTLAGLVVEGDDPRTGRIAAQEFAGPPAGPWSALGPVRVMGRGRFAPVAHVVEGNRLFTAEFPDFGGAPSRWVVREPGSAPATIPVPADTGSAVAGDLVAIARQDGITVRNWRTGARLARYTLPHGFDGFDLRADGAVVVVDERDDIVEYAPGATPRRLPRAGDQVEFAGDRIVFTGPRGRDGDSQLQVVEPDGRIRAFGVPSNSIYDFGADAQRVLWRANGCLLTALITDPPASAPDPGVCARSEVFLGHETSPPVRDRRVVVRVNCVAAPPPGCRGRLTVRLHGRTISSARRFRIPVGRTERVRTRLTRRGLAAVTRLDHRLGAAPVFVRAFTVDPDGRRRRVTNPYVLYVRGSDPLTA